MGTDPTSDSEKAPRLSPLRWVHRVALLTWALAITSVCLPTFMDLALGEVDLLALAIGGGVVALAATAWFWPRVGAIPLVAAGLWGLWASPHPLLIYALALPAIILGLFGLLSRR